MPEQISKDFRASFLLRLTKELIENTEAYSSLKIKEGVRGFIIKEKSEPALGSPAAEPRIKKEEIKELVREKIKKEFEKISGMGKDGLLSELKMASRPMEKILDKKKEVHIKKIPPVLRIPEPALPKTVSYLKPIPTHEEINLAKLNVLIRDPLVKIIECNGPGVNVLVIGMMGRKSSSIKLSREEIEEIVGKFAAASRIPVNEGLFKAAVGNLVISAVISETVGIKFIIRKISPRF
jgi:hypothetical protein